MNQGGYRMEKHALFSFFRSINITKEIREEKS